MVARTGSGCKASFIFASVLKIRYKVGFEQVLDLVRQRRVYLEGGFAYVPASDLVSIVANQFRMHLSKQLSSMARAWPALELMHAWLTDTLRDRRGALRLRPPQWIHPVE